MGTGDAKRLTPWMGAVPPFRPDVPPRDWERQHDHALQVTALNADALHGIATLRSTTATARRHANRPVPRQASCHFLAVDKLGRDVYFY